MEFEFDIDTKEHAATILKAINGMRTDGNNHDIVIKVGDEEILAHKNVLMAGSKYFEAMFSHDTMERKSGSVEMKDVDFDSVKACIDFIYTGEMSATSENREQLLTVASIMQLFTVIQQISKFLQESLKQENFFRTKKIAERFDIQDLGDICDKFAMDNFTSIAQETEFLEMELEYICFLLESKKKERTMEEDKKVMGEDKKFEAIIKWIKADTLSRGEHLISIMKLLNFNKITLKYSKHLAAKEELCYESAECMRMLLLSTKNIGENEPNAILIFDLSNKKLQAYKPSNKQMKEIHSLPQDTVQNQNFVAINVRGVLHTLHEDQSMYRLDTNEHGCEWHKWRSMLRAHGNWLKATLLNDDIFVTGQNSMEKHGICKGEWQIIDTVNISCHQNTIVSFQQCVYSIGGGIEGKTIANVHKYFPNAKEWSAVSSMHHRRSNATAAYYEEKIFVAGGFSKVLLDKTEFYDATCDIWTQVAPLTIPRKFFSLCVIENKMFAVGCHRDPLSIEVYDETELWKITEEKLDIIITAEASCTGYFPE